MIILLASIALSFALVVKIIKKYEQEMKVESSKIEKKISGLNVKIQNDIFQSQHEVVSLENELNTLMMLNQQKLLKMEAKCKKEIKDYIPKEEPISNIDLLVKDILLMNSVIERKDAI
jgi:hypothetical protein